MLSYLSEHFIVGCFPLIIITIGFLIFTLNSGGIRLKTEKEMVILMIFLLVLSFLECIESYLGNYTDLYTLRHIMSVILYIARPAVVLMLIYICIPKTKYAKFYWIPEAVNAVVYLLSFIFPHLVFSVENNDFERGPLGFTQIVIMLMYAVFLLYLVIRHVSKKDLKETIVLVICTAFATAGGLIEVNSEHKGVMFTAIAISIVFYYLFQHVQYSKRDVTTGLLNRQSYYNFADNNMDKITAVIMVDMNGLKEINDNYGHEAGDKALAVVANIFEDNVTKKMNCYRAGGDEFSILCTNTTKGVVEETIAQIKKEVAKTQYSVAMGYGYKEYKESISDLEKRADKAMYEDKNRYYIESGKDRRHGN